MLLLIVKLVIAGLLLGSSAFTRGRSFLFAWRFWIMPIAALIIFTILIYYSFLHYQFWSSNEFTKILLTGSDVSEELKELNLRFMDDFLSFIFKRLNILIKFLFPAYGGGEYLLFFLLTRLWGEYFVSLVFALLFLWASLKLNKKYDERFFCGEEPYLGAAAVFIAGSPGWLYYLIILLAVFLIFNLAGTVKVNLGTISEAANTDSGGARFSLYYFWLTIAIVVILTTHYFKLELPYYALLKI